MALKARLVLKANRERLDPQEVLVNQAKKGYVQNIVQLMVVCFLKMEQEDNLI